MEKFLQELFGIPESLELELELVVYGVFQYKVVDDIWIVMAINWDTMNYTAEMYCCDCTIETVTHEGTIRLIPS